MPSLRDRLYQRGHNELVNATSRSLREPSFTYKFLELSRIRQQLRAAGVKEPVFTIDGKDDAHAWAKKLGIRTAALIGIFLDPDEIPWSTLPERVVVKPVRGSTSRGVFLLERRGDRWRDVKKDTEHSSAEIVSVLRSMAAANEISLGVLVEKLVNDPRRPDMPPFDYKIWTFFGQIGVIEAKMTGPDVVAEYGAWRNFDSSWKPIRAIFGEPMDSRIPKPIHAEEMLELARFISSTIPRPFVRVDLYDDADGPVFGEITPEPGGSTKIRPVVDRAMGQLWENAEARLKIRDIRDGRLAPADHLLPDAFGAETGSPDGAS